MKQSNISFAGRLLKLGLAFAALATLIVGTGRLALAAPPLGSRSFLSHHVRSLAELRRELDKDPRLIRIYSELLHMSPEQVKSEFSRLKLTRLPDEGVYKIYGALSTAEGLRYSFKVRRLPKGIEVFTLEDGTTPVILKQCGNLLRGYYATPGPIAKSVPVFNEMAPDAYLPAGPAVVNEAITLETPVESEWGWVEDTVATAPTPDFFPPPGLTHHVPPAWWPWLFPLVGLPFIGSGGGGGGGGVSTFGSFPVFVPDTTSSLAAVVQPSIGLAVPESGAIAALAAISCAGLALLLRHVYRPGKSRIRS